jgi:hypothetical protein
VRHISNAVQHIAFLRKCRGGFVLHWFSCHAWLQSL